MKEFLFITGLIFLCFINANFAQQTPAKKLFEIKGVVKNQDKISLAELNLFFDNGNSTMTAVSDDDGGFVIKLPVGKYKITANEATSKKFAAFIEVFDSNLNPNNFELIIETNSACCSQTSDGNITEVIKYVAPPYPPAARAVRASGEVVVAIKIDKEGKVMFAKTESGHPLLRAVSEKAAEQWLFTSDENGTEREGKIIFAFVNVFKENLVNQFIRPNRLVILPSPPLINTTNTIKRNR